MKIAVEGCCHGQLDDIYRHIEELEIKHNYNVDLLLVCGDFEAIRNHQDLQCMAVPAKYRQLGAFHKYYTGKKRAPMLTIVIGGNHEASNYFWELFHGGWVAPNIYFLGHAGCVQVNGIRIAGASGIFKSHDFQLGNYEKLPYDKGSMRSIYHIREFNVRKLSLLSSPHIFLSHDWPQSIEHHGDLPGLLRQKPFFREDINAGKLGSPPLMGLLKTLQPQWWFSAHMHVRFEATVVHDDGTQWMEQSIPGTFHKQNPDEIVIEDDEFVGEAIHGTSMLPAEGVSATKPLASAISRNPDEIALDDEEDVVVPPPPPPPRKETKFLALDKCLPRRSFLEVIDFPSHQSNHEQQSSVQSSPMLTFDPEWLAITRAFHPFFSTERLQPPFPEEAQAREMVKKDLDWVQRKVRNRECDETAGIRDVADCQTFVMTAPGPGNEGNSKFVQPPMYPNPQTEAFCAMLDLENKVCSDRPIAMGALVTK